ncbi:hypothetical protein ABZX30_25580 [Streptomyces sp. NPDC004542]|uniref:hypothetical protein n=1 Tax=Streptomyces sp. NPDC004542 TaxID=3154281 RepID=UPI0033B897F7
MTTPPEHESLSGPTAPQLPVPVPRAEDSDDYSATVLASHWIQGPDTGTTTTLVDPAGPLTRPDGPGDTVLRFGPGVTAAQAHGTRPALSAPTALATRPPRGRRLRRHALPALVVSAVLLFLWWQEHTAPELAVSRVTVHSADGTLGCGRTADITGVVRTNGREGTLAYRWERNDGTSSGLLHASVGQGQRLARLNLRWTFQGRGRFPAAATLRILSPTTRTATVRLTYACR